MLIVLGVLVALTVDTWISERNDARLRDQYLARLADDLAADRLALERRIAFFTEVRDFGLDTAALLSPGQPASVQALLAAYYASEQYSFSPIRNTYVDLQSTGNIRLLGNLPLRLALAEYHELTTRLGDERTTQAYREIVRGITPWPVQLAIREHCPTTVNDVPTGFPSCTPPGVGDDVAAGVFSNLRAYPRIGEVLTYRVPDVDTSIYLYRMQLDSVIAVLARL